MISWRRLRLALLGLALIVGGFLLARAEGLLEWSVAPASSSEWVVVERQSTAEIANHDALHRQTMSRRIITQDLIDGRTNLVLAVEQFVLMNRNDPLIMPRIRWLFPSESDEESTALQVIFCVKMQMRNQANTHEGFNREEVLRRIDLELLEMKRAIIDAK